MDGDGGLTRRELLSLPQGEVDATRAPARPGDAYHVQVTREAMACTWAVMTAAGEHAGATEVAVAALDLVEALEAQLTVYRETSEVSRINREAAIDWVEVEERLFALLQQAVELHAATEGALDIAAGALIKAWGIKRREGRVPDDAELARALEHSGTQHVRLDAARRGVHFERPVELNLGSIGKGYALDRAAEMLAAAGIENYLMHGGRSSVLCRGRDASGGGEGWSIGIGDPLRPGQRLGTIELVNQALSTSGAGTQFFRHGGKRYGHILDPRSGWPAEGVLSTTVVAASATMAEALSTAFYVLGPEGAARYCAVHRDVGALVIVPGGGPQGLRVVAFNAEAARVELAAGVAFDS